MTVPVKDAWEVSSIGASDAYSGADGVGSVRALTMGKRASDVQSVYTMKQLGGRGGGATDFTMGELLRRLNKVQGLSNKLLTQETPAEIAKNLVRKNKKLQ